MKILSSRSHCQKMRFLPRLALWLAAALVGAVFVHELLATLGIADADVTVIPRNTQEKPSFPIGQKTKRRREVQEIKNFFAVNGNRENFPTGSGSLDLLLKPLAERKNVVMIDGVPMMADMAEQYLEVKRKKAIERRRPANATEIKRTLAEVHELLGRVNGSAEPKKVVIVSTWRSGSTFLGQVLANYPGVFYHYEPLSYVGVKRVRDVEDPGVSLISKLFNCKFNHGKYMNYTRTYPDDMVGHNHHVWTVCKSGPNRNVCLNETFLEEACRQFPVQVMKLVRVGLNVIGKMIESGHLDAKVIFLIRDPRATYHSRISSVHWCKKSQDCMDPRNLCKDLETDLAISKKLTKRFPFTFRSYQYENLVSEDHPQGMRSLFSFLGLDYSQDIRNLVFNLTHSNEESPWSVRRKASERVSLWQSRLDSDRLRRIQKLCKPVLEALNFEIVNV